MFILKCVEIELYVKQRSNNYVKTTDSLKREECHLLSFWKKIHGSHVVLSKVAARVLSVSVSHAIFAEDFNLASNIITHKEFKLYSDIAKDIALNH